MSIVADLTGKLKAPPAKAAASPLVWRRDSLWIARAFALTFLSECFWPPYIQFRIGGGTTITAARILGLITIFAIALDWRQREISKKFPLLSIGNVLLALPLLIFLIWRAFSGIATPVEGGLSHIFGYEIIPFIFYGGISLILFREENCINLFIKYTIVGSLLMAIFVIPEYVLQSNFLTKYSNIDDNLALYATMDKYRLGHYRAQGTFTHPLLLVDFCIFTFSSSLLAITWKSSTVPKILAYAGLIASVLMAVATGSRSGILLAGVLGIYGLILTLRNVTNVSRMSALTAYVLSLVAIVMMYFVAISQQTLLALFSSGNKEYAVSTGARQQMLEHGINYLGKAPIFGFGYFKSVDLIGVWGFDNKIQSLDNYWMMVGLDSGVVCIVALFVTLMFLALRALYLGVSEYRDSPLFAWAASILLLGMMTRSLHSLPYLQFLSFIAGGAILAQDAVRRVQVHRASIPVFLRRRISFRQKTLS
jgi:hypothetical protein